MAQNDKKEITATCLNNAPTNAQEWNDLALLNNNFLQSTHNDIEHAYFNQEPIYIELRKNNILFAGIKVYYYISGKLPRLIGSISSRLTQFGEILYSPSAAISFEEAKKHLTAAVLKIVSARKIVAFHSMCYYGGVENIITLNLPATGKRSRDFSVATVMLGKTEDELWKNLHPTQRQNITKAKKSDLQVYKSEDINLFVSILEQTYKRQGKTPPGHKYILHHYAMLRELDLVDLVFVRHKDTVLSAALIQKFGDHAYYAFGGSIPNNLNAGHLLHWNIILEYNKAGITQYILGEVANGVDEKNLKFSKGITEFKTRFGTTNIFSGSREYILRPFSFLVWKKLYSIATRVFKFD